MAPLSVSGVTMRTWLSRKHYENVWRARMSEFRVRKEAVNKCMELHDRYVTASRASMEQGDEENWLVVSTKAETARECAALIARCDLGSPLVSTDKAEREKAWSDLLSR
jgi:hypothetical protein